MSEYIRPNNNTSNLTEELILKCFPNKECILYNLDTAVCISEESDRINLLCQCYHSLRNNQIEDAIQFSKMAGYRCMAAAIEYHYQDDGTDSSP